MAANGKQAPRRVTLLRYSLQAAGYAPIPINGKIPPLAAWQTKLNASREEIKAWEKLNAHSTGLLCERTPGLDIDILNTEAAEAVEQMVRDRFKKRGTVLVRIGKPPKRLIPFRTAAAFQKIKVSLVAPDGGTEQKIEFLAKGQPFVAFGMHPDTHAPYHWDKAGEPGNVRLDELPEISADEARQLVNDAVALLVRDFGYRRGADEEDKAAESFANFGKLDWSKPVANILAGVELHDNIVSLAASLVTSRVSPHAAEGILKALMNSSAAERDQRWRDRYNDIPRTVAGAEKAFTAPGEDGELFVSVAAYAFPEEKALAPYDWLLGRHLLRGQVCGTAAGGGTGKSSIAIVDALAMASGKPLLFDSVSHKPLRVVLINLEDDRNTMDKRIAAAMRHHGLKPEEIGDRLIIIAKGEIKFKIAKQLKSGEVERNEEVIAALANLMIEKKADVLSIDSFIRTHQVSENDNNAVEQVIECFETIAERANCCVHLWHHTRKGKGDGSGATVESSRGAMAFIDACRSVRVLETMSEKQAEQLGITMNHRQYFRAFSGKRNFAPHIEDSNWFHIASVELKNAPNKFTQGDSIGVVEAITTVLADEQWRESVQAAMWAGKAIAPIVNLDPDRDRAAIKQLLNGLIRDGILATVTKPDEKRRGRLFIVPGKIKMTPVSDPTPEAVMKLTIDIIARWLESFKIGEDVRVHQLIDAAETNPGLKQALGAGGVTTIDGKLSNVSLGRWLACAGGCNGYEIQRAPNQENVWQLTSKTHSNARGY